MSGDNSVSIVTCCRWYFFATVPGPVPRPTQPPIQVGHKK